MNNEEILKIFNDIEFNITLEVHNNSDLMISLFSVKDYIQQHNQSRNINNVIVQTSMEILKYIGGVSNIIKTYKYTMFQDKDIINEIINKLTNNIRNYETNNNINIMDILLYNLEEGLK